MTRSVRCPIRPPSDRDPSELDGFSAEDRRPLCRTLLVLWLAAAASLGACQTARPASSGALTRYDGMIASGGDLRANVASRRDDAGSDAIRRIFIERTIAAPGIGVDLDAGERDRVLREIDRQVCYELSERFVVAAAPGPDTALVRAVVVRITPTGRMGSMASAAAGFIVPIVKIRAPTSLGGLAVEAEMLAAPTGEQIAVVSWARRAQILGVDAPSLSRVGDALQLAEPFGDAVGDAFASPARPLLAIPEPDPCAAFGPRRHLGRLAGGVLMGVATGGLYSPEVAGTAGSPRAGED